MNVHAGNREPQDIGVHLGPLFLQHPFINASGTLEIFEVAETFGEAILLKPPVAAYVCKTVTLEPRRGNAPPRILETPGGMINAIGLSGEGLRAFISNRLPRLLALPCPLILSIGGFSQEEYVAMATSLRDELDRTAEDSWTSRVGLELNISCPNVHSGCMSIGADSVETHRVVGAVRKSWPGLLIAKLTPNVTDIVAIARAAEAAGADAIAAVNTYKGLAIDRKTLKPFLGNTLGGVSGPAIKPLALRMVYELFAGIQVPIVGMGGVACLEDALEFFSAGAVVVAVGSCGFRDPWLPDKLASGLPQALEDRGIDLGMLVGWAHIR